MTRTVENFGEVFGPSVFVTASGTYQPVDEGQARPTLPLLLSVEVQGGALHVQGARLPLPIRCVRAWERGCRRGGGAGGAGGGRRRRTTARLHARFRRGQGKVHLQYADPELRVWSASRDIAAGSLTVQVREDRLAELLAAVA